MASSVREWIRIRRIVVVAASVTLIVAGWFVYRIATDGPGPGLGFRNYTGLNWPHEARIVQSADDHGGFQGDGEFSLIFDTDRANIQKWLVGSAPWGEWQHGPVPGEIGFHCTFGGNGVSWGGKVGEPRRYLGDES